MTDSKADEIIEATELNSLMWEIYQEIGRSSATREMSDADKAEFVESLKRAAMLLEDQLPVYN